MKAICTMTKYRPDTYEEIKEHYDEYMWRLENWGGEEEQVRILTEEDMEKYEYSTEDGDSSEYGLYFDTGNDYTSHIINPIENYDLEDIYAVKIDNWL